MLKSNMQPAGVVARSALFQFFLIALVSVPISGFFFAHDEGGWSEAWLHFFPYIIVFILKCIFMPGIFAALFLTRCYCLDAYPFYVYYTGVWSELLAVWAIARYWGSILRLVRWIQ